MTSFSDVMSDFLKFWYFCQLWRVILAKLNIIKQKPEDMLNIIVLPFRILKQNVKMSNRTKVIGFKRKHTFNQKNQKKVCFLMTSAKYFNVSKKIFLKICSLHDVLIVWQVLLQLDLLSRSYGGGAF